MSHVATVDVEVKDLDALAAACKACGLELVRGQESYRCWFSGWPRAEWDELAKEMDFDKAALMPPGFTFEDMGKCEHAIRVAGGSDDAYEIGIVRRRDGRPGYQLLLDPYDGGSGLVALAGQDCGNLRREYSQATAIKSMIAQGFTIQTQIHQADGTRRLVFRR